MPVPFRTCLTRSVCFWLWGGRIWVSVSGRRRRQLGRQVSHEVRCMCSRSGHWTRCQRTRTQLPTRRFASQHRHRSQLNRSVRLPSDCRSPTHVFVSPLVLRPISLSRTLYWTIYCQRSHFPASRCRGPFQVERHVWRSRCMRALQRCPLPPAAGAAVAWTRGGTLRSTPASVA